MYLTQGLHRSLQAEPQETALVSRDRSWTFTDLVSRVARLAGGLRRHGAQDGDRIGVLSENSTLFVELALAVPWAGLVLSPVNLRWSRQEVLYQLRDAEIDVLVVDAEHRETAAELQAARPRMRLVVQGCGAPTERVTDHEQLIDSSEPVEDRRGPADRLAALVYTGGTTGAPKGVMLTHGQIATSSLGTIATLGADAGPHRFLHAGPLYHMAALGALYTQVAVGSTHVVIGRYTSAELVDVLREFEISSTTLVPTVVRRVLDHLESTGRRLPSLRSLAYGGGPISEAVLAQAARVLPAVALSQRYGMTELGPIATILGPADHRDPSHPERLRSAGKAAMHAEVRVVDPDDEELPTGAVGEIVVRGANMMTGYWRRPEETAAALRNGWMHTGDVGYLDGAGYLYVVDRLKDMIVSGGENVYSTEVEKVLATHPAVHECAVVGVPDSEWGERVHAVLVLNDGAGVTLDELREHCSAQIARYKAPRSFEVVRSLPVSPIGKILKRQLRRDAEERR
ncbi:long-chain-fatty-acid--CoA ligase [Sphaerisporangium sp. NPDC051011]|uniref:class I adenylate-forming enzyme family protein n=1 Tax=Sphaerisporangium sp. NPDC051011 TaxID=3155792 RepID=UPI0033E06FBF